MLALLSAVGAWAQGENVSALGSVGTTPITTPLSGVYYVIKCSGQNSEVTWMYDNGKGGVKATNECPVGVDAKRYVWTAATTDGGQTYKFTNLLTNQQLTFNGNSNGSAVSTSADGTAITIDVSGNNVGLKNSNNQYIDMGNKGTSAETWSGGVNGSRVMTIYEANLTYITQEQLDKYTSAKNNTIVSDLNRYYGLSSSSYSTNADQNTTGSTKESLGLAGLTDNNKNTYFHSSYQNDPTGDGEYHYIQADLGEAQTAIYLYFHKRTSSSNNIPQTIEVSGSNDGTTFTYITTLNNDGDDYLSEKINFGNSYRHVRFTVTATNTETKFFTVSEFYVIPSNTVTDAGMDAALKARALTNELETAEIDEYSTAYATYLDEMAPIDFNRVKQRAQDLYSNVGMVGYPNPNATVTTELQAALSLESSGANYSTLLQKTNAFEAERTDILLPQAGKYYVIEAYYPTFTSTHNIYVHDNGDGTYKLRYNVQPANFTDAYVFTITPTRGTDFDGRATYTIANVLGGEKRNVSKAGWGEDLPLVATSATEQYVYALAPLTSVQAAFNLQSIFSDRCTINMGKASSSPAADTVDGDISTYNALDNADLANVWRIREVSAHELSVTDAGYATLYLDYATTIPGGVEVYTGSRSGDNLNLEAVSGNLPADEGVVVKANEGSYVFVETNENVEKNIANELRGTVEATDIDVAAYVLSKPEGQSVGFYQAKMEGGKWTNNANRAYLPAGNLNARVLTFNFDDNAETGINAVEIEEAAPANAAIYDLSGRRVQSAKSGLYIINGKKVIK